MPLALSLYLDLTRFLAALVVFVGHMSGRRFTDGLFWQIGDFMGDAVTIFFVLSGFVIAYVTSRREGTVREYFLARAARIYSVALPALVLTFLLDSLGTALRPELYGQWWGYEGEGKDWQFLSGFLFLNRIWFADMNIGSNLPYWSLGFEVWYYAFFGILLFAPGRWKISLLAAGLLVVGPKIALYFPLWMLGVLGYRLCRHHLRPIAGFLLATASLGIYVGAILHLKQDDLTLPFHLSFLTNETDFVRSYGLALLFTAHLIGVNAAAPLLPRVPAAAVRAIRWAAGTTFSIYLFHLPIAQFLITVVPWPPGSTMTRLAILLGTFISILLLAEVTERRKAGWQRLLAGMLDRSGEYFSPLLRRSRQSQP